MKTAIFVTAVLSLALAGCTRRVVYLAPEPAEVATLDSFDAGLAWALEPDWGDEAKVEAVASNGDLKNQVMSIEFKLGERRKIVVSRNLKEPRDFSKHNAILADIENGLRVGCLISVGLVTGPGGRYVEGPPSYVRPGGRNIDVVFRLDAPNFKSEESEWQYNQRAGELTAVRKIFLVIYPLPDGRIRVDNLRLARFEN